MTLIKEFIISRPYIKYPLLIIAFGIIGSGIYYKEFSPRYLGSTGGFCPKDYDCPAGNRYPGDKNICTGDIGYFCMPEGNVYCGNGIVCPLDHPYCSDSDLGSIMGKSCFEYDTGGIFGKWKEIIENK